MQQQRNNFFAWVAKQYEMVQTSLAAWLKKPKAKNEEVVTVPMPVVQDAPKEQAPLSERAREEEEHNGEKPGTTGDSDVIALDTADTPQKSLAITTFKLPSNATIASITSETLPAFRRMTGLLLPVPYPDKFYNEILTDDVAQSISAVALWHDTSNSTAKSQPNVVAGIRCRLISHPAATSPLPSLYISTITTLAPFRGHGLARALLRRVTAIAIEEYGVGTVTAHMWERHEEDAGGFYEKAGFRRVRFEEGYYRKLRPGGAWLFERVVGPSDLLGEGVGDGNG